MPLHMMLIDAHTLANPEVLTQHLMAISRTYGPDGNPEHDYDHDDHGRPDKHPHDSNGGHNHDWKNGVRGPAYSIGLEPIAGVALVTVCAIGIVVVATDDVTGIGVIDDFLFGPLGAGVGEGLILIFG